MSYCRKLSSLGYLVIADSSGSNFNHCDVMEMGPKLTNSVKIKAITLIIRQHD